MNRQLKFRVWDKITNQYLQELGIYYWHIPYSLDGEEITGEANLVGLSELLKHDNFVTQQYTGLTDKNNNPIFEGDIIKEHHFEDWGDKIGYEYIGIVIYKEYSDDILYAGYKTIPAKNQNTKFRGNAIQSDCEVIGNIFKNPELLK
jgi:uncharacterized phage protein (TIGR01671 family)